MEAGDVSPLEALRAEVEAGRAAGVRGDVAVKIFGDDFEELGRLAGQVQQVLAGIPETAEATGDQAINKEQVR